jgi:hypothetical protein
MIVKNVLKTGLLSIGVLLAGCQDEKKALDELENNSVSIELKSAGALLETSYEKTTYVRYHCNDNFEKLTELDFAHINPSEEKQRVKKYLMPDGTVNMTIEELDFERTIHIPHETAPCNVPKIRRTEIRGNTVTFYDGSRRIIGSHPAEMSKQTELAAQIRELGDRVGHAEAARSFATGQGRIFEEAMEKTISDARSKGQLVEHDDRFVTVRTRLSDILPDAKESNVVIIDRNINRIVASATYDEAENLMSRTFYAYDKESAQAPNATVTEAIIELPSGAKVWQITSSRIEKYNVKLNN